MIEQPTATWPPRSPTPRTSYEATSGPIYGRWVEPPAAAPELTYEQPYEPPAEPRIELAVEVPAAETRVDPPAEVHIEEPEETPVATLRLVPRAPTSAPPPPTPEPVDDEPAAAVVALQQQAEFLRLLEVVTQMCDHVIDYIEADRAERHLMIETLKQLARVITEGAAATVAAATALPAPTEPTEPTDARERLIGGSMAAGPDPVIDLRQAAPPSQTEIVLSEAPTTEIAVEVRGRFGDRWVDGFEICAVMTTPDGPRYRLRRHRDGVVLPELFDATSIRHIETFEQLGGDPLNHAPGHWSRS